VEGEPFTRYCERRDLPLVDRKWRLVKLIGKAKKWRAIQYSELDG